MEVEGLCLNTHWYNCLNILISFNKLVAPFNKKNRCLPQILWSAKYRWHLYCWLVTASGSSSCSLAQHWPLATAAPAVTQWRAPARPQPPPWPGASCRRSPATLTPSQGAGVVRQVGHRLHLFINCKIVSWISGNISHSLLTWRAFKCEYFASLKADIFLNVIKLFKLFNSTLRRSGSHVTIIHYVEQWNCFLVHTLGTNI